LTGIVGAPLLWLTALETGYVLAYQSCDDRSQGWVIVPTFVFAAVVIAVSAITLRAHPQAEHDRPPMPFLGWVAIGVAGLMVVVMIATSLPPLFLHPCD